MSANDIFGVVMFSALAVITVVAAVVLWKIERGDM